MSGTLGHTDEHRSHVEYGGRHSRVSLEVLCRIARRLQNTLLVFDWYYFYELSQ